MKVYGFAEPLSGVGQLSRKTGSLEEEPAGQYGKFFASGIV